MNTLRNKGYRQINPGNLKRSKLRYDYYAVSSIEGPKHISQVIKVNSMMLGWKKLGELAVFINKILKFQYRYGKQI